jgi:hypothetical protein
LIPFQNGLEIITIYLEENCSEGKQCPFGPSCTFKGKAIP